MRLLFILFSLGLGTFLYGQDLNRIRTLERKLVSASPKERFDVLLQVAFEYRNSFPDSAIIYSNEAYEIGRSLKLSADMARPLNYIGIAYGVSGNFRKSLDYLERAIKVATDQKDSLQLGYCFNNLGRMLLDADELEKAFTNFEQAGVILKKEGDQSGLAYVIRGMSDYHRLKGNLQEAERLALEALDIRYTLAENRAIISSLLELGLLYQSMGNSGEAFNRMTQAEDRAKLLNDPETITEVRVALGEIALKSGDIKRAEELSALIEAKSSEIFNKKLLVQMYALRAGVFFQKKSWRACLVQLDRMIKEARNTGNLLAEKEGLEMRIVCFEELGDEKMVDQLVEAINTLDARITNNELQKETERLHLKLSIEKNEAEIADYKLRQLNDRSLLFKRESENLILIGALALFFVACGLLFFLLVRRNQLNRRLATQNERILQQQRLIQETNASLEKRNNALNEMSEEKDSLMSVVAHDLKSPLNQISGFTRLIQLEGPLTENQKDYVSRISSTITRGLDLINNILEVNSFQRSNAKMTVQEVDLSEFVREKENSFRVLAEAKNIGLKVECSGSTLFRTVPDHLARITDNLVSNAIKFSPPGSAVGFSLNAGSDSLTLIVSDAGPGFTEEDRQGLFKQFRKLSARPTGNESSSGLGLAIVKVLVERLRGTINLDSVPGQGAKFIVTIPVSPA